MATVNILFWKVSTVLDSTGLEVVDNIAQDDLIKSVNNQNGKDAENFDAPKVLMIT